MLGLARLAFETTVTYGPICVKMIHLKFFTNIYILCAQDKLMTAPSDSSSSGSSGNWLFKNKEHGKASAAVSLV